ncbi:hypothetical protein PUN28_013737 [Cardiocondyla obscurior]|uniref:Uncharacterized protein n=1 Tax=Cardiocondyla obscurior TaxID=286306 RepID=A0AAW2F2Q8_9HYME
MTRGEAEAKYFLSRRGKLTSRRDREREMWRKGGGGRGDTGERHRTAGRWNKGGERGRMHLCSGTIRAPQAEEKLLAGFENYIQNCRVGSTSRRNAFL